MDYSPPGSSLHLILHASILEWVGISFSRYLSHPGVKPTSPALAGGFFTTEPPGKHSVRMCVCVCVCVCACARVHMLSHVWLFPTPIDCSPPGSSVLGTFQEYFPFPSPRNLPDPGIEPASLMSPTLVGGFFTSWATKDPISKDIYDVKLKQILT